MRLPFQIFSGTTAFETTFVWLAAGAFLVGAVVNATGARKIRASFEQLGFPDWWCWPTAAVEFTTALLLIGSGTRSVGVALGAGVMLVAIAAIVRIQRYRELPPPLLFLLFLTLASLGGHS